MDSGKVIHQSVMLDRCITLLTPAFAGKDSPIYLDATLGLAGHAEALLEKFSNLTLIGLDRDKEAISLASSRLARFKERIHIFHATYDNLTSILNNLQSRSVRSLAINFYIFSLICSSIRIIHKMKYAI